MKIAFVSATGGYGRRQIGGAERFIAEMLPPLTSLHQVHALVPSGEIADVLSAGGVIVHSVAPARRIDLGYRRSIRALLEEIEPDVVSAHLLSAAMHVRSLGRGLLGGRLLVTLHSSLNEYVAMESGGARRRALVNRALDRTQRVLVPHTSIAVSTSEQVELTRLRPRRPVVLISNSLPAGWGKEPVSSREAAREMFGLSATARVVGYLGRMEHEKGADLLSSIAQELPPGTQMLVVGDGVVSVTGENVTRCPYTSDPASVYSACDVMVVPSRAEVFGRVALEAVSTGTPVVHTGVGGLADLMRPASGVLSFNASRGALALAERLTEVLAALPTTAQSEHHARWYREEYGFDRAFLRWNEVLERTAQ